MGPCPVFGVASCWHASRIMLLHGMLHMQWGEGMVVRICRCGGGVLALSYALTGFASESCDSLFPGLRIQYGSWGAFAF
jgi:hypothetical protein